MPHLQPTKTFYVDQRIQSSCIYLNDWKLSSLYIKNESRWPWFILVPKIADLQEIYQLTPRDRCILMDEIAELSEKMKKRFNPDKINVGSLGNIVKQLHIHVIARFEQDCFWPHSIWQPDLTTSPYAASVLNGLLLSLADFVMQ